MLGHRQFLIAISDLVQKLIKKVGQMFFAANAAQTPMKETKKSKTKNKIKKKLN